MKICTTVKGKSISYATTFVLIFALIIFIAMTNLSLTYAATNDNDFNSNAATSGPLGYIPPPPLTTSTTQNDQIANSNNLSTANTISSSSSGQSQLNQEQQPNSNCNSNTIAMIECGGLNPSKTTTTPTQQQPQQDQNGVLTNNNNLNTFGPTNPERTPYLFSKCSKDVSGKWIANDGGVYYIQQKGNQTRWFGSTLFNDDAINNNKGFEYANEAHGGIGRFIDGTTQIVLVWDDIAVSDNHLKGTLNLLVDPSGSKLIKKSSTGGFGPSEWNRKCL